MKNSKWLSGGMGLGFVIMCALALAAVPGIFSTVNSVSGYKVNGAAGSAGQALCSDGTFFDTPCGVIGSAFYQTLAANGTAQTQRPTLNLISGVGAAIACADNGGATRTDCTLSIPALTATLGASCAAFSSNSTSGCTVLADGKIEQWIVGTCIPNNTGGSPSPQQTVTFPLTFTNIFTTSVSTEMQTNTDQNQDGMWQIVGTPTTSSAVIMYQAMNETNSVLTCGTVWAIGN